MSPAPAAPVVHGPRAVPDLRDWLVDRWQPGEAFSAIAGHQILARATTPGEVERIVDYHLDNMQRADLWWVDSELVDLMESSCEDLPPTTLHPQLAPSIEPTLVIFERPLQGLDADHDAVVRVDGWLWGWQDLRPTGRPCLSMTMMHRSGEYWMPIGRTDWVIGEDWSAPIVPDELDERQIASMAEDRRWLLTLWALAQQPNVVTRTDQFPDRPARRRAARAGKVAPTVRLVRLRRSVYDGAGASREQVGSRTYHVRWPVRGHWRMQPYGPNHSLRRPTYIAPYIAGPEGAPLKKGAVVRVLGAEGS